MPPGTGSPVFFSRSSSSGPTASEHLLRLRTDNLEMDVIMVDDVPGVPDGFRVDKSTASLPSVTTDDL